MYQEEPCPIGLPGKVLRCAVLKICRSMGFYYSQPVKLLQDLRLRTMLWKFPALAIVHIVKVFTKCAVCIVLHWAFCGLDTLMSHLHAKPTRQAPVSQLHRNTRSSGFGHCPVQCPVPVPPLDSWMSRCQAASLSPLV